MQLKDLVKPLSEMSDDELMTRLREVRQNREVVRPAAQRIVARAEEKKSRGRVSEVERLLEGLSEAEKEQLLKQLEGANSGTSQA